MSETHGVCAIVPANQTGFRPLVFGMGILLGPREVVTCAHVVNLALGPDWQSAPEPPVVRVCFPFAEGGGIDGTVDRARWFPPDKTRQAELADIAVILLSADAPGSIAPAVLGEHASAADAKVYGFRAQTNDKGDRQSHPHGEWAEGKIIGAQPGGRAQFAGLSATGARVQKGFSGAGVYDPGQNRVVGMIVEADRDAASKVAQFIDVRSLRKALAGGAPTEPDRGLVAARFADAAKIRLVLADYLGSRDQRIPFGGRDAELAQLNDWLSAPGADSYRLLVAPMARGKSALLARWAQSVHERDPKDPELIYVPVNVYRETSSAKVALRALAEGLAAAMLEPIPRPEDHPNPHDWCDRIKDYLLRPIPPNRKILIVLDGLDEAVGWSLEPGLFPLEGNAQLRVLISARSTPVSSERDWLDRLGWPQQCLISLPPLDDKGIGHVLREMGDPLDQWSEEGLIRAELVRLTEGDPLLVRLYVDALHALGPRAAGLAPDDLRKMKPGLGPYFKRWWDDQYALWKAGGQAKLSDQAKDFLLALAAAQGPLKLAELRHTLERKIDGLSLRDEILPSLRRFVRGDGIASGFALQHPRFREFFIGHDGWLEDDYPAARSRFLAWGERVLRDLENGSLAPQDAPGYLVEHLGDHLEEASANAEQWLPLATIAWCRAWERIEGGSHSGFLVDLNRCWSAIRRADDEAAERSAFPLPHLGAELACSLIQASITSLSGNLPPRLTAALVRANKWTGRQALRHIAETSDLDAKAEALFLLSQCADLELLEEIERQARGLGSWARSARVLVQVAERLGGTYAHALIQEVCREVERIGDPFSRDVTIRGILPKLSVEQALKLAMLIAEPESRAHALGDIARRQEGEPRQSTFQLAYEAARCVGRQPARSTILGLTQRWLKGEQSQSTLEQAMSLAGRCGDIEGCCRALVDVVRDRLEQPLPPIIHWGMELDAYAPLPRSHSLILAEIAERLAELAQELELDPKLQSEVRNTAVSITYAIHDSVHGRRAWDAVNRQWRKSPPENALDEDLARARAINDSANRCRALAEAAERLAGDPRTAVLDQALAEARSLADPQEHVQALAEIAQRQDPDPRRATLDEALALARSLQDAYARSRALDAVAQVHEGPLRRSLLDEARSAGRLADQGNNVGGRSTVFAASEAALRLEGEPRRRKLLEALEHARSIADPDARLNALADVLPLLEQADRQASLDEAFELARSFTSPYGRSSERASLVRLLSEVADRQEGADRQQTLDEIAALVRHSGNAYALEAAARQHDGEARLQILRDAFSSAPAVFYAGSSGPPPRPHPEKGRMANLVAKQLLELARTREPERRRSTLDEALSVACPNNEYGDGGMILATAIADLAEFALRAEEEPLRRRDFAQALTHAEKIPNIAHRGRALAAIARCLAESAWRQNDEPRRRALLDEAVALALSIEDSSHRSRALAAIASSASRSSRAASASSAVDASALLSPTAWPLLRVWLSTRLPRPAWLSGLSAALPAIDAHGGPSAITSFCRACFAVAHQWP